jgi:hypothetical protein
MEFIQRMQELETEQEEGVDPKKLMDGERWSVAIHKLIGEDIRDRNV